MLCAYWKDLSSGSERNPLSVDTAVSGVSISMPASLSMK